MTVVLFHQAVMLAATGDVRAPTGFVALLLAMHDHGYTLTAVIFCLLLVALGHLAYRSTRYPSILSTLLIVSLIVATGTRLLWPDLPTVFQTILAPAAVAGLWLVASLVIRGGIRVPANNVAPTALSWGETDGPQSGGSHSRSIWLQRTISPGSTCETRPALACRSRRRRRQCCATQPDRRL